MWLSGVVFLVEEKEIGKITHYFSKISVAVIELSGALKVGDTIHVKGAATDFTQKIDSMQIDRKPVQEAGAGQSVGMKVTNAAHEHDRVFLAEE
jgi:hypothetical protein